MRSVSSVVADPDARLESTSRLREMSMARLAFCAVIVAQFAIYHAPPGTPLPFHRFERPLLLCVPLVGSVVLATVFSRFGSATSLRLVDRFGLVSDLVTCWALIWSFNFDHESNLWALLAIVVVEGAFEADLLGALGIWLASTGFYALREWHIQGSSFDGASVMFRMSVVGAVALLAGMLARQRRSMMSEIASRDADLITIERVGRSLAFAENARQAVVDGARELSGATSVTLLEPDILGRAIVTTAHSGIGEGYFEIPLDPIPANNYERDRGAQAFLDGDELFIPDTRGMPGFDDNVMDTYRVVSLWLVPVRRNGRSIGLIGLGFPDVRSAPPERLTKAMSILRADAAIAIERADATEKLATAATTDPLTGLLNRRGWEERIGIEAARAQRESQPVTLVLLDLDHFKKYNDSYGHAAGDALLQKLSARWAQEARATDLLARLGGDEFAFALPGVAAHDAQHRVEHFLRSVGDGMVGASAGITTWALGETSAHALDRADHALYKAKAGGRGLVVNADVTIDLATAS